MRKTRAVGLLLAASTIEQMPKDSVLNPTDIQTITSWINAGAPQ